MMRAIQDNPDFVTQGTAKGITPTIIPRSDHGISRRDISDAALKVLYKLDREGYRACLVGGGVRDLLLGRKPKDFDVATDATPDEVRALFRNCRLIGRRFRLAHVHFGREIIEVATFRAMVADSPKTELNEDGRLLRDNTFGSIEEDALRRDFTVNALYYDIHDFSVIDYAGGMEDIRRRQLRLIGDPETRYKEDPVRMMRALRFSAKLDFEIDPAASEAIHDWGHLLADIPPARLYDEILKMFHSGHALRAYELLREYHLLQYLFPSLDRYLRSDPSDVAGLHLCRPAVAPGTPARDPAAIEGNGHHPGPAERRQRNLCRPGAPHCRATALQPDRQDHLEPAAPLHQYPRQATPAADGPPQLPRRLRLLLHSVHGRADATQALRMVDPVSGRQPADRGRAQATL